MIARLMVGRRTGRRRVPGENGHDKRRTLVEEGEEEKDVKEEEVDGVIGS